MTYAFIRAEKANYPVQVLCETLNVSTSGYYAWCAQPTSKREQEDEELAERIRVVHDELDQSYGSPRMFRELRDNGISVGRRRVARVMREYGLRARRKPRFRVTTDSNHRYGFAPNLLRRDFRTDTPNQVWAADVTYIPTKQGWLFLAVVLDLASRRIVGWSMGSRLNTNLSLAALRMAIEQRQPSPGLVHHSDRGKEYASPRYRAELAAHGLRASMSRTGDCWDNAPVESFFSSLKNERVHHRNYNDRQAAMADIFDYIEIFYNRRRRHSTLGYRSPVQAEQAGLYT